MRAKTAALAAGSMLLGGLAIGLPVGPAFAADLPDLAVTAAFDKASYAEGEPYKLTIKVTNKGKVTAVHVHHNGGDNNGVSETLGELETGFDLAAGATRTVEATGAIAPGTKKYGYVSASFSVIADNGEANEHDNLGLAGARVPGAFGSVAGLIYPASRVGQPPVEGGPGVPGVKVTIVDWDEPTKTYGDAVTDANGRFVVHHVPTPRVHLRFVLPPGWQILFGEGETEIGTQVVGEETAQLIIPAKQVAVPTATATATVTASPNAGLPVTGSNSGAIAVGGLLTVGVGAALLVVARRRRTNA